MKQLLLLILLIICYQITIGQDIHFSQFNNSPLNLSPSLIGNFTGDFRFVANQRTQWNAVTTPYSTSSFSAEAKNISKTPMSGGLSVYNDKAGDSRFSTLQITIGGAYAVYFNDSAQSLNFSIQPAFTQRRINYDPLKFDNQYNGIFYDANLNNGESFANSGRNYFNLHSGVSWNYLMDQRKSVTAGISLHNLINPKQSFFNDGSIDLKKRLTIYTNGLFMVSEKIDVLPSVLFMAQHNFKEFIFGGSGKYHLNRGNYKAVYLGVFYRNKDASYITAELDYQNFHFGVSYDFNLSSLTPASNYKGGFEFSVIYIIHRLKPSIKHYKACPNYI